MTSSPSSFAKPTHLQAFSGSVVADIMTQDVFTVYEGWSIKRLAGFFVKHNVTAAPVVASDETLVGVVTQADVIRFESRSPSDHEIQKVVHFYYGPHHQGLTDADLRHLKEKAVESCTVNAIMSARVLTIKSTASLLAACAFMVEHDIHRLFVTERERIAGVVTVMDVLRLLVD